ncbi:hypothetical protein H6P81_020120 [Aristolochia fimbriata]|uniref:Uncharacterized protein n=1 Tax=Aristolochia fimbriata TaxID=158543 RepID=A0AAV7DTI9_ARIFI|nr:hypothetical protein H6P81_020120 [Aristolochia fimbriata]
MGRKLLPIKPLSASCPDFITFHFHSDPPAPPTLTLLVGSPIYTLQFTLPQSPFVPTHRTRLTPETNYSVALQLAPRVLQTLQLYTLGKPTFSRKRRQQGGHRQLPRDVTFVDVEAHAAKE